MRICVIGLGQIGASLAGALAQSNADDYIVGYDYSAQATQQALADGFIHSTADSVISAVTDADIVVLAVYIGAILDLLPKIAPHLKAGALIMDVGSTKAHIVQAMNALPENIQAVGGHPMTGPLTQNIEGTSPDLFSNCIFVLTPTERTSEYTQDLASKLVERIGSTALWMDALMHDRYVALVSHLNRLLPIAILSAAREQNDDILWKLAAGSFRETTRLASQPLGFWRDVFATNTQGIPASLRDVATQLERLAQAIENDDLALVESLSEQATDNWQHLYGSSKSQPERENES